MSTDERVDSTDERVDTVREQKCFLHTALVRGGSHTVLIRSDGVALAFGHNGAGQCDLPDLPQAFADKFWHVEMEQDALILEQLLFLVC